MTAYHCIRYYGDGFLYETNSVFSQFFDHTNKGHIGTFWEIVCPLMLDQGYTHKDQEAPFSGGYKKGLMQEKGVYIMLF